MASACPGDVGIRREPVEPTPYGAPRTEDVRPQCLNFMRTHPSTQHPVIYVEVQAIRQTTAREAGEENQKIQAYPPPESMRL